MKNSLNSVVRTLRSVLADKDRFQFIQERVDRLEKSCVEAEVALQARLGFLEGAIATKDSDAVDFLPMSELRVAGLAARGVRIKSVAPASRTHIQRCYDLPIDVLFDNLKKLNPRLFQVWEALFANGTKSYYEQKEASCSHRQHFFANAFSYYIDIYSKGNILDIGCGPHGVPSYLATHDISTLWGIDPLPLTSATPFEVVRGFNEFLPWADDSFDTVLSATSLDHVLSVERALNEVRRVLKSGGHYLVWLASMNGAPEFDEQSAVFEPIDEFHLFHFDRVWIEPIFGKFFEIINVTVFPVAGFEHVFYYMRKE